MIELFVTSALKIWGMSYMENTERAKIASIPGFCIPSHRYSFFLFCNSPQGHAGSTGCFQAGFWLEGMILKVGSDWIKQSKSLYKPTHICLYLHKMVNCVLKSFRLFPSWMMFQMYLLAVLQSCLLPMLGMCCSLDGSTTQNRVSALLDGQIGKEISVLLVWNCFFSTKWLGCDSLNLSRTVSAHNPASTWGHRGETHTLRSLYTFVHLKHTRCGHFTPLFTWILKQQGN